MELTDKIFSKSLCWFAKLALIRNLSRAASAVHIRVMQHITLYVASRSEFTFPWRVITRLLPVVSILTLFNMNGTKISVGVLLLVWQHEEFPGNTP